MKKVEYRIKEAKRYIVTRFEDEHFENGCIGSSIEHRGSYENADLAYEVATALCRTEHEKSGEPIDSPNFIYPKPLTSEGVIS